MEQEFFIKADDVSLKKIKYLENIIGLMPGHVYWKDRDCILQGCNDQQAFDVGLKSREEIVGKSAYDILWQDQPEEAKREQAAITDKMDKDIMASGVAVTIEESVVLPNGEIATFLSRKVPILDDDGKVVGLLGISFDITERKKMELELAQAKEEARKANASKSVFLTAIERIVRTSLSCILGAAQVLQRRKLPQKSRNLVNIIADAAQEVIPALDRVHYYLELEQNSHLNQTHQNLFNLKELFEKIIIPYQEDAKNKTLAFYFDYVKKLPVWVRGDRRLMLQVLHNLLNNAAKYTAKGSISCTVAQHPRTASTFDLMVTVKDTGKGIREDVQKNLFGLFLPVQSSEPVFTEAGLNLSISAKLLELMGGSIQVDSKLHQGSTFTISIPLTIGEAPEQQSGSQQTYETGESLNIVRPRDSLINVLCLEDNSVVQHVLKVMIEETYNAKIEQVYTVEDALKCIGNPYDIIFCDINLPDGSGLDFMRALKQHMGKNAPRVIVITTFLGVDEYTQMGEAGAMDLLAKPFTFDDLIYMIDKYVFSDWKQEEYD